MTDATLLDKAEATLVANGHDPATAREVLLTVLRIIRVASVAMVMAAGSPPSQVLPIYTAMIDSIIRGE